MLCCAGCHPRDTARAGVLVAFKAAWVPPSTAVTGEGDSETEAEGASAACGAVVCRCVRCSRGGRARDCLCGWREGSCSPPAAARLPVTVGPAVAGDQSRAHGLPGWGRAGAGPHTVSPGLCSSLSGFPVGKG